MQVLFKFRFFENATFDAPANLPFSKLFIVFINYYNCIHISMHFYIICGIRIAVGRNEALFLVYDVADRISFRHIPLWLKELSEVVIL